MDPESLMQYLASLDANMGIPMSGVDAGRAITPRLTAKSKNLPGQQYDKVKAALKEGPPQDWNAPATVQTTPMDPMAQNPMIDQLMAMIMGQPTPPGVPIMNETKDGMPYPENFNPMSIVNKLLEQITASDEVNNAGMRNSAEKDPDDKYVPMGGKEKRSKKSKKKEVTD